MNKGIEAKEVLDALNRADHPLRGYSFILLVEAVFDLPCKRITGISQEKEYEYIQEGGLNNFVHMREKPLSKPYTFQVERYVGVDYFDPLILGTRLEQPIVLFVNRTSRTIGIPQVIFTFSDCMVTGKNYGELNAEQAGLMLETTTITYQSMEVVKM